MCVAIVRSLSLSVLASRPAGLGPGGVIDIDVPWRPRRRGRARRSGGQGFCSAVETRAYPKNIVSKMPVREGILVVDSQREFSTPLSIERRLAGRASTNDRFPSTRRTASLLEHRAASASRAREPQSRCRARPPVTRLTTWSASASLGALSVTACWRSSSTVGGVSRSAAIADSALASASVSNPRKVTRNIDMNCITAHPLAFRFARSSQPSPRADDSLGAALSGRGGTVDGRCPSVVTRHERTSLSQVLEPFDVTHRHCGDGADNG